MVKKYKDKWCYRFNYTDSYGTLYKPFKSGFRTKREAEDAEIWARTHIEEVVSDIRAKRGENVLNIAVEKGERLNGKITFQNLYNSYMTACKEKRLSVITLEKKEFHFEKIKQVLPELLNMPVDKINEMHVQPLINACKTPSVVYDMYKFLHAMFEFAIQKRILRENCVKFVNKVRYVAKKKEHRGLEFANLLLKQLRFQNSKLYTPVLLALTGGITREECPPLLESDLNYNDYTIRINKAVVRTKNGYVEKEQKTVNRDRIYYANSEIFTELHRFKLQNNIKSEYLCCNFDGTMMKTKTLDTEFRKFIKTNGLPHCTFHQLRTILSDGQNKLGFDIYTSANTLGHSDIRVTSKHYRTHDPEITRKAITAVFNAII